MPADEAANDSVPPLKAESPANTTVPDHGLGFRYASVKWTDNPKAFEIIGTSAESANATDAVLGTAGETVTGKEIETPVRVSVTVRV